MKFNGIDKRVNHTLIKECGIKLIKWNEIKVKEILLKIQPAIKYMITFSAEKKIKYVYGKVNF